MKKKIFWGIYYIVAAIVILIISFAYIERANFSWFSFYPIVCIVFFIWAGFYIRSRAYYENFFEYYERLCRRNKWEMDRSYFPTLEVFTKKRKKANETMGNIFFIFAPIMIPYIYLLSNTAKFLSIFWFIAALLLAEGANIAFDRQELKYHQKEIAKKRKEQEQKEEFGKWK